MHSQTYDNVWSKVELISLYSAVALHVFTHLQLRFFSQLPFLSHSSFLKIFGQLHDVTLGATPTNKNNNFCMVCVFMCSGIVYWQLCGHVLCPKSQGNILIISLSLCI